jgi:hypothetical protein
VGGANKFCVCNAATLLKFGCSAEVEALVGTLGPISFENAAIVEDSSLNKEKRGVLVNPAFSMQMKL